MSKPLTSTKLLPRLSVKKAFGWNKQRNWTVQTHIIDNMTLNGTGKQNRNSSHKSLVPTENICNIDTYVKVC